MRGYWDFVQIPGVGRLLFASTFARLAYAMVGLAIFFQVQAASGSVALAGLAVGVSAGCGAITAGPRGHLVDRFGQTRPLYVMVPAYALSSIALAVLPHDATSAVILAALVGLTAPPINISIRPLWLDIVGTRRVRMAYGIDTAYMNALSLLGPVIATVIAVHLSPALGMVAVGLSMLTGGLLLAANTHSRAWVPEPRQEGQPGLFRSPAIRLLAAEGIVMGLGAGLVIIGIPALATLEGKPSMAGWLMAAMGLGGILGTLWAGAKATGIAPARGLRMSTLLFAIALLPLAFVPLGGWMFAVILTAWTFLGPANVFYLETIDIVRPRGTAVAALGSLWMIEGAAAAVGNSVGGTIAQWWGPQFTLALGSAIAVLSPVIFTIGIRTVLRPAAQPPHSAPPALAEANA